MKKLTTLILAFLPWTMWAHQNHIYTFQFDNVEVRFETSWLYEEINNARIIGKYSALLAEKMNYEGPILLDFIHDYGHTYQGKTFSYLNIGSEEFELIHYTKPEYDSTRNDTLYYPIALNDTTDYELRGIKKETYRIATENSTEKVVIRQFGKYFDIDRTLKLLHSAISQPKKISTATTTDTLTRPPNIYYLLESIPKMKIDSISRSRSIEVEKVLEQKIYRECDLVENQPTNYSYFSQSNKYFVYTHLHSTETEVILDTLDHIYSFKASIDNANFLFVFATPNKFRHHKKDWLNQKILESKSHNLPINEFEYISSIEVEWLGDDLFLISYQKSPVRTFSRFLYLAEEDIVIKDFDSYLNSYRKN